MKEYDAPIEEPQVDIQDPQHAREVTESGELEPPVIRRRIECDGRPEVASRRVHGRGAPAREANP